MKNFVLLSIALFVPFLQSVCLAKSGNTHLIRQNNVDSGLTIIDKTDRYSLKKTISMPVRTYEAWVDTYETNVNQGSTILSNYTEEYNPGISFRVYTYGSSIGKPQLNIRYDRNTQKQFTINTNICGTGKRHIAFTISNTQIKGYLDGVLKNTWSFSGSIPDVNIPYCVGGDNRSGNQWWFRGTIYSIAAFSTVRTQSEITSDMTSIAGSGDLLINFDFTNTGFDNSADLNNPLVSFLYEGSFVNPNTYDYTFAVIPDTQGIMYYYPEHFSDIYDCIIENKDDMNISLAIGLGDITEKNIDSEWAIARNNIYRLKDNDIPFSLVRGNHDVGVFGTTEEWRQLKFSQYFDNDTYKSQMSGFYNNQIENSYRLFEVCGVKYLLINLDYGASDEALNWANFIVEQYPTHNVIVTTHAFLFRDGTLLDENDVFPPAALYGYNNGDDIWNKFISKHENISLVLCGHDPEQNIVKSTFVGDHGNKVTCLLIDPQYYDTKCSPLGCVAFLHFSNGGSNVSIDYYSSIQKKFFRHYNQLEFELETTYNLGTSFVDKNGGEYSKIDNLDQLNGAEVIITNSSSEYSIHFSDVLEANPINTINGKMLFNDNCDSIITSVAGNQCTFYIVNKGFINFDDSFFVDASPCEFDIEISNDKFYVKYHNSYLGYDEETNSFRLIQEKQSLNFYYHKGIFDDSEEEADRYVLKFLNSYLCGFDDYTNASSSIWCVLEDDYNRLSNPAKKVIGERITEEDLSIQSFKERYLRVINKYPEFNDYLELKLLNSSKMLSNTYVINEPDNLLLIICFVVVSSFALLCLLGKNSLSNNQK